MRKSKLDGALGRSGAKWLDFASRQKTLPNSTGGVRLQLVRSAGDWLVDMRGVYDRNIRVKFSPKRSPAGPVVWHAISSLYDMRML